MRLTYKPYRKSSRFNRMAMLNIDEKMSSKYVLNFIKMRYEKIVLKSIVDIIYTYNSLTIFYDILL